jgi:hypothetical protein
MNILNINLPKLDPSAMWTIPTNLTQQAYKQALGAGKYAWDSIGGLRFPLPRFEANFFSKEEGNRPVTDMANNIEVKDFNFKKSLTLMKNAPYAR